MDEYYLIEDMWYRKNRKGAALGELVMKDYHHAVLSSAAMKVLARKIKSVIKDYKMVFQENMTTKGAIYEVVSEYAAYPLFYIVFSKARIIE